MLGTQIFIMTKEELKTYVNEAIDALDVADLEEMFPNANQPSLYALAHELLGMRGRCGSYLKLP